VRRHGTRGLTRRELLELDTELHRLIVEASGNELLVNLVASLAALSQRSRELTVKVAGVSKRTRCDHEAIVGAIAARQPQQPHDAMAAHGGLTTRPSCRYPKYTARATNPLRIKRG
jgi:DNA-binding FadR family transcriptional regulator